MVVFFLMMIFIPWDRIRQKSPTSLQTPPEKAFRVPNTYSQGIWRILEDWGLVWNILIYLLLHETQHHLGYALAAL